MSFVSPWALTIGLAAAVPLALHLLRRDIRQRIEFPAVRYLHRALRRTARSLRIRDRLLLVVRVLLLGAVALAAAGPLAGRGGTADHAPTDVAVLVDNSASMTRALDGRTVLDAQLDRARETLAQAGPADRFWVLPTVGQPVGLGVGRDEARRALSRIPPTHGAGDVAFTAREALRVLPAGARARELHVYTDLQAADLRGEPLPASDGFPVVISVATVAAEPNIAVLAAQVGGPSGGGAPATRTVTARVERMPRNAEESDTLAVRLELDGETVGLARAAAGSEVVFTLVGARPGLNWGRVEISPSGLRLDDARHFVFRVAQAPGIRHLGSADGFLSSALETLASDGMLTLPGDASVVIAEGVVEAPESLSGVQILVLVPPADAVDLPRFNEQLSLLGMPWRVVTDAARGELALAADEAIGGLAGIRVYRRYRLWRSVDATGADTILLRTEDGAPWLVRETDGRRTSLLLASSLDPRATSLPVSAAMIPFVEALLLRWTQSAGWPGRSFDVGEPLLLPPGADSVLGPDGTTRRVDGGAPFTPYRSGLYRVITGRGADRVEAGFAANVPAGESDPLVADARALEELFPGFEVRSARSSEAWMNTVYRGRIGADLSGVFLALVALLALAEALLAAPARGRTR
jgi:hypothetical protein